MTTASSPGIGLAFGIQDAKGTPVTVDGDFKKVRVNNANLGTQQGIGRFPIEVGGTYHPGGSYKMFYAGAGGANWSPRLEGDIGYLLYALLGGVNAAGTSDADGVYTTTFRPRADVCDHPWMTLRRFLPNCTSGKEEGEYMEDAKMSGLALTVGAGAPAVADMSFLSIGAGWASDASDWSSAMSDVYEDTDSVILAAASASPIFGAVSGIDLGDGENTDFDVPTIGFQLAIANSFSADGIRPELIVGSFQPDDAVLVGQTASFQLTYKWKDPYLYRSILRHGHDAYTWSSTLLKTDVSFILRSPELVGSSATQYQQLTLTLAECALECPRGITLSGGGFLTMVVTGTAETQTTAAAYMTAELINGQAYTDLPDAVAYT